MEIIAVYWEPKIKTYGFQVKAGLSLATATLPFEQVAEWGGSLQDENAPQRNFIMALAQPADAEALRVHLLFEPPGAEHLTDMICKGKETAAGVFFEIDSPVELIYFQGPHFGDRYGIADAAFKALAGQEVLAAGFSGASVYIVVAEKQAQATINCLSEAFITPAAPEKTPVGR
jgi:hypothetical protein